MTIFHHDPDPPTPSEPTPDPADAAAAALDAALADQPLPEVPAPAPAEDKPAEAAKPEADPFAEPAKAEAPKPEAEKPAETEPTEPTEPVKDEAVEKEIAELNLKERSAERFRELSAIKAEYEPIKAALHEVGIKDVAQVKSIVKQAEDAHYIVQRVEQTGANPEQYLKTLDYLTAVNAMSKGDLKAAEAVYNMLSEELTVAATLLGKEIPGIVDPLKGHPDLKAEVEDERITRERALEIARQRNVEGIRGEQAKQTQAQQQAAQQQTQAEAKAIEAGREALNQLGTELAATDPGGVEAFKAKYPALVEKIKAITAKGPDGKFVTPPSQWATKAAVAYATIPAPAPKAQPKTPLQGTGQALRSGGVDPGVAPQFKTPEEALNFALDQP